MEFINFDNRDWISVLADFAGLFTSVSVTVFVIHRIRWASNSEASHEQKHSKVKKKTKKSEGRNIFGPYSQESEEYEGSAEDISTLQKAQTVAEVQTKAEQK